MKSRAACDATYHGSEVGGGVNVSLDLHPWWMLSEAGENGVNDCRCPSRKRRCPHRGERNMLMLWEEISSRKNMSPILSKIRVVFGGPFLKPSKPTFSGSTKTQCKYDDVIYQLIVAYLRPPRPSMQRGPCSLVLHLCVNIEFVHTIQELHHETDPEFYQCPALTFLGSPDHARTMSPASCWCTTSMSLDCWSSVDSLSRKDMNLWEKLHQYVVTFGDLI